MKRLALVDDKGVERVVLANDSVDVPIFGKVYKRRSPATGIILYNAKGDETGGIAMLDDGTVSVTLDGYKGKNISERVSMYVFPDGRSGILVKDTTNNTRVRLAVDKDSNSIFEVLDAKEKVRFEGLVSPNGKTKYKKL
ncbi:MAG: hypothetical protein ACRBBP_05565 [Bdellovibrionales bacterium]